MAQSRHYKTCTSASILAIDGLNWESWVLHKVSPLEQFFLDMFVCLCYFSFWEHKHVPCPYLLTYLQFNVIKWAKQRPGQNPIDVKSDEAIQI